MESLEQINHQFLKVLKEVQTYRSQIKIQGIDLDIFMQTMNYHSLSNTKKYLITHRSSYEEKENWLLEEWRVIQKSRTFHYQQLEYLIATIVTKYEGKKYYPATRLIKHSFQVDPNRPFYHMVSFITEQHKDLDFLLLERPLASIIPFYQNHALIIRPLEQEMESQEVFEQLVQKELEIRKNDMIYISTSHDIIDELDVKKTKNRCILTTFPFSYVNDVMEHIILKRYYRGGKQLSKDEMMQIITDLWIHYNEKPRISK